MAATKFSFFVISTLDRGDFPRIIVIDLYFLCSFPPYTKNFNFFAHLEPLRGNNKINKAITMMRGKSPRSDVEMTKKLNFVAAILDF